MKRITTFIVCFALISFFTTVSSISQEYKDSRGKDFWLTFMPNFHSEYDNYTPEDSLHIYVVASVPTTGTIEYTDKYGILRVQSFNITDPSKIFTFKLKYANFEILGYNRGGNDWKQNNCEKVINQSFHVSSDNEVTVYALSQAINSSDAFLVLPTDALGNDYVVMAYNSDGYYDNSGFDNNQRTPSQFAIVASENNTVVEIIPSTQTYIYGSSTQTITLNQGQVYLVQARINTGNLITSDLTGSIVTANKPIAVFGGQQRATLPINDFIYSTPSRDCIIEQLPPVKTWGLNAFLTPYPQPANITQVGTDLFRILAGFDSTDVYINKIKVVTLNKGGFYEGVLDDAALVTATSPILVAQYKKCSNSSSSGHSLIGDPFMMIVPPFEQFMSTYRVINCQALEYEGGLLTNSYTKHYITIVSHKDHIGSLQGTNMTINSSAFITIPNSEYKYANIEVKEGIHDITGDKEFGVYVYGYGSANSYGYVGGMFFAPVDLLKPNIVYNDSCFSFTGYISDSTYVDTGIIEVNSSSKENVELNIDKFNQYDSIVRFTGRLVDFRQDGKFSLSVVDSNNNKSDKTIDIPGFTLAITGFELLDTIVEHSISGTGFQTYQMEVSIHNYGKFTQNLSTVKLLDGSDFKIISSPKSIKADATEKIVVEIVVTTESIFIDTLFVSTNCYGRNFAVIKAIFAVDHENPDYNINKDECSFYNLVITDSLLIDSGIEEIEVINSFNCDFNKLTSSKKIVSYNVSSYDPYQDAYYELLVTDYYGNQTTIKDTILGLTFEFILSETDKKIIDFGTKQIGDLYCDSVKIKNTGIITKTLNQVYFKQNVNFSVPQSQFPLVLAPGESKSISVCYFPSAVTNINDYDTLALANNCVSRDLPAQGFCSAYSRKIESNCGVSVKITTKKLNNGNYISDIMPNPVMFIALNEIYLAENSKVRILVYSTNGSLVKELLNSEMKEGYYELNYDLSDLPNQAYFVNYIINNEVTTKLLFISK